MRYTVKKSVNDLKEKSEGRKRHWIIGKKMSRHKEDTILTKRNSEGLRGLSLKKTLKIVEKSTKWRYKSIKKKKVIRKMTKTLMEMIRNQLKMNIDWETRKKPPKRRKCFQIENSQQSMKKHWKDFKNSNFQEKVFRQLKKSKKFCERGF